MKFRIAGSIFASGAALSLLLSGYGRNHGSLEEHEHVRGGDRSVKARVLSTKKRLDATRVEGVRFADQPRIQRRLEKIRRKRQLTGPFKRSVKALGGANENPIVNLLECSPNVLNDDQELSDFREDTGLLSFQPDKLSDCDEGYVCLPSTVSSRGGFCAPLKTTRTKAASTRRVAADVDALTYPDCLADNPSYLGDGYCNNYEPYNTAECGWDGGDCVVDEYPGCHVDPDWLGDGDCDGADYNTATCGWDGGDCNADNAELWRTYPDCKGGVYPSFIGDDGCDGGAHNTAECGWDGGDCVIAAYPDCHVDSPEFLGSGSCYQKYNTAECGWDGGDCVVDGYPDCHVADPDWLGDEFCDYGAYNTAECGWDGGDCKKVNARLWKTYPDCKGGVDPSYIGDDYCDYGAYNTAECGWDGGDCDAGNAEVWKVYPDCKGGIDPDRIGDGDCDGGAHNTVECGWDGGDCIEENKLTPPPGWPGSDTGTGDTADSRTETLSECIASCLGEPIP